MNKEDLIKYQQKIKELNEEEKKLRDLYLKELANGTLQGPSLQEMSITKPFLKYYDDREITADMPDCSIYEYIYNRNNDNLDHVALDYYGKQITYRELFENIDKAEKMFINNGVKPGDIVSMSVPTTPETVYMFYALNKMGAISNMIDPRTSPEQIHEYVNEVDSKLFVGIDLYDKKFIKALKGTSVEKTILISAGSSMPNGLMKGIANTAGLFKKEIGHDIPTTTYNHEIFAAKDIEIPKSVKVKADDVVTIVHTGGTTGKSKGVQLTNKNLNASSLQAEHTGYNLTPDDTWLNIMPPFIAYGVGNGLHLPLSVGMKVVLIPRFDPRKFADYILKYKPNEMAGVPSHYERFIRSPKLEGVDLSFLKAPIVGGDSMNPELEKEVTEFLRAHGCKSGVLKGYGMSEVSAAVSLPTTTGENKLKSVGVPFSHTKIGIFNYELDENDREIVPEDNYYEELAPGQIGQVCMSGPNTMKGYYENPVETDYVLRKHADGETWVHSGDLGYMDKDGRLFILDRMKRIIVRHDGFKIFPSVIKDIIADNPAVALCEVIGVRDYSHVQGKLPKAFIVLKDEYLDKEDAVMHQINRECAEKLSEYYLPITFETRRELPLTLIGKVDYKALENEEEEKNKNRTR